MDNETLDTGAMYTEARKIVPELMELYHECFIQTLPAPEGAPKNRMYSRPLTPREATEVWMETAVQMAFRRGIAFAREYREVLERRGRTFPSTLEALRMAEVERGVLRAAPTPETR